MNEQRIHNGIVVQISTIWHGRQVRLVANDREAIISRPLGQKGWSIQFAIGQSIPLELREVGAFDELYNVGIDFVAGGRWPSSISFEAAAKIRDAEIALTKKLSKQLRDRIERDR